MAKKKPDEKAKTPQDKEEVNETQANTENVATEKTEQEEKTEQAEPKQDERDSKIKELEKDLAASKEAHIRTLAEYDNYRKRSVREKEGIYSDAKVSCLSEFLPVLDNFERAAATADSDIENYKKGVDMIHTSFCDILKKLGVEAFGEVGEPFDPKIHNGVMHVDDESMEENVIADVFSKGYKLGEKVLRPAMVKVAN